MLIPPATIALAQLPHRIPPFLHFSHLWPYPRKFLKKDAKNNGRQQHCAAGARLFFT